MNASDDSFEWVTVTEAGRRLNISPSEVRRRIRVGTLTGERQPRGPGDTRDRFMVQMPTQPETEQEPLNDASANALARAALEQVGAMANALERATDRSIALIERAARAEAEREAALAERDRARQFQQDALDSNHEYFERWMDQVEENSDERQRTADALARVDQLADELSHLRVDHRRAERLAEQMQRVANAQEARANEVAEQLAAERARADAAEARGRERRWYDPRTW